MYISESLRRCASNSTTGTIGVILLALESLHTT